MSGCSGCGTTPILLNKFIAAVGNHTALKPGPFDGVRNESRAFTNPFDKNNLPEHLKPGSHIASSQMNGNGMYVKFVRRSDRKN